MRKIFYLSLIFLLISAVRSYSFDLRDSSSKRGNLKIESVVKERIGRERDIRVLRNLLSEASKDDYSSLNDIIAGYPGVSGFFSEALYQAKIEEIEILDQRGVAYIEFALMKLEDRLKRESGDLPRLTMLIRTNSYNNCISLMDLGVVIMQYIVSGNNTRIVSFDQ
jgi:hypothetical protein